MNNDQLCLSICKRLKNTCRMYIHDTKSIYRRYKEYLQTMQKVLPTIQKKYLQTIQKVFADDTGNLPEETTIRDREFAYTTACLVEGQFFGLWNVPLFVFLVCFFCNTGKNVYILVYRLPPQFLVVRQSLLFAV